MNLTLKRTRADLYGIFGALIGQSGPIAVTLEHSYPNSDGSFYAKLTAGVYDCKRGTHLLPRRAPFEAFQVMNVPGHTGILVHKGNYNGDSEGCVLVGVTLGVGCILESEIAFDRLMALQSGLNEFQLTVQDLPSS